VHKEDFRITAGSGEGERLDVYLSGKLRAPARNQVQKEIDKGRVRVNSGPSKSSYRLKEGDLVEVAYEVEEPETLRPENIPLDVLYLDDQVVVVRKPGGMVVHPGAGVRNATLVNALLFRFPDIAGVGEEERPGIVHRLDKETSGIMVVARTLPAYRELLRQFKAREVEKTYLGVIWGRMPQKEGRIDRAIGRHPKYRQRISVKTRSPKQAVTFYKVLQEKGDFSLLEIKPLTGRTHQIRVHLAAAGHPIVGDGRYGRRMVGNVRVRLFLHAHRLAFSHPSTRERLEFISPMPPEFADFLRAI